MFHVFSESPETSLPIVNIPVDLRLDNNPNVSCISPLARPAPHVELRIAGNAVPSSTYRSSNSNTSTEQETAVAEVKREWNNESLSCCYTWQHSETMCSFDEVIDIKCWF